MNVAAIAANTKTMRRRSNVGFTITSAFKWWVRECIQTALALDYDGEEVSYAELYAWASRVAAHLVESGVKPGDRISIFGTNSLEYAVLLLGTMLAGGISAPLSFRSSVRELRRARDGNPAAERCCSRIATTLGTAREALGEAEAANLRSLSEIRPLRDAPATWPMHCTNRTRMIPCSSSAPAVPRASPRVSFTLIARPWSMRPNSRSCSRAAAETAAASSPRVPTAPRREPCCSCSSSRPGATIYAQSRFKPGARPRSCCKVKEEDHHLPGLGHLFRAHRRPARVRARGPLEHRNSRRSAVRASTLPCWHATASAASCCARHYWQHGSRWRLGRTR